MKIVHSDRYELHLGAHVFPTAKYARVRQQLIDRQIADPSDFLEPPPVSWEDLALVHTPDYLDKLQRGRLTREEIAQMEIPWSRENVEAFRAMTGGTILAARLVLHEAGAVSERSPGARPDGGPAPASAHVVPRRWAVVAQLGGGFHHAFCNHGEGFCMFNDVAVAIRRLERDGTVLRAAIVDCDVHHGNGTASIFTGDRSVFTFSMHQLHNYPAFKPPGALDIALDDRTTDEEYVADLREALPRVLRGRPQILFYLAGADPYADDQLGGLRLTRDGLRERDRVVFEAAREACVPVVITLAGGYARHVQDTVDIHVATVEEAKNALVSSS